MAESTYAFPVSNFEPPHSPFTPHLKRVNSRITRSTSLSSLLFEGPPSRQDSPQTQAEEQEQKIMSWFVRQGVRPGDPQQIKENVMDDHKKAVRKCSEGNISTNSSICSVQECSLARRRKRIAVEV